ncbi:cation transporter [Bacillus canaveralius]|uniref:Cation transporter n=1 Tax=Bacillus canaveralius TaxID=1403243 RepID=A0A2N5GN80_9BACI|nr:cation diffusion facilitator family transporter [Bacillus canaveralius]PLR83543.1 cation transporter [Bacillus canaveralius]PLS00729.1 cation transporter [Bacillus canaveralius]RSK48618.1 cation transporter [Bacillus canaveralius]
MGHHHGHSQGHGHSHGQTKNKKALFLSFLLIATFMFVEVIGGILTNSLALLSDAGHMLSDAAALGLSFFAIKLGERQATRTKSFGYRRFEIIAAALNGLTLILISLYIFNEAIQRFLDPPEVQSLGMLTIAFTGLLVNIVAAWILMRADKDENLNVRSAFLHVIGDMVGSVGAIVAALLIYFLGWGIADPIASVIVAVLVLVSGWRVMKDSIHVLMEGTPIQIEAEKVKVTLLTIPNVNQVHDLHIWSITSGMPMLSCHIAIDADGVHDTVLLQAQSILHDEFGIEHSTLQVENEETGCPNHHGSCN